MHFNLIGYGFQSYIQFYCVNSIKMLIAAKVDFIADFKNKYMKSMKLFGRLTDDLLKIW